MKKSKRVLTATLVSATILSAFALPSFASTGSASSKEITDYIPHIIIGSVVVVAALIAAAVVIRNKKASDAKPEDKADASDAAAEEKVTEMPEAAMPVNEADTTPSTVDGNSVSDTAETGDTAENAGNTEAEADAPEIPSPAEDAEPVTVTAETAENSDNTEKEDNETAVAEIASDTPETENEAADESVEQSADMPIQEADADTESVKPEISDSELKPGEFRDPETGCIYTYNEDGLPVAPDGMIIRYKWSFLGRLISADNTVKYRYMTLRRVFLSYKKVRSNVSWNFDSYFYGRKCLAKIKVRGKHLVVYFNLDPKEMEGSKYVGKDVSSVSRYKTVPFAYQINGERKLQYAIELIRQLLDGVELGEPEYISPGQAQYAIPHEEFVDLFRKGYIKINSFLAVDRSTVVPADDDEDDDEPLTDDPEEEAAEISGEENVTPIEPEAFNFTPPKK